MCLRNENSSIDIDRANNNTVAPRLSYSHELSNQLKTAIPCMISMTMNKLPWFITLHFVGLGGADELAVAALATSIFNVTGLSLSVGLSTALCTLTGQARGNLSMIRKQQQNEHRQNHEQRSSSNKSKNAKNMYQSIESDLESKYHEKTIIDKTDEVEELDISSIPMTPLSYLLRGIFVCLLFSIPIGLYYLYGIKEILVAMGQRPAIAEWTEQYLRILVPGLWSYSIYMTLSAWLQYLEMADVPAYGASVGLILHVPMNMLFIHMFGFMGSAVATVVFQIVQPLVILLYLFKSKNGRDRLWYNSGMDTFPSIPIRAELYRSLYSSKGITQYLSLAFPGVVLISEWWASEIAIFLAGTLPNPSVALSAMSIYQAINSMCFGAAKGVSTACSARVGANLGMNEPKKARHSSNVGLSLAVFTSFFVGANLYFVLPHDLLPSFFTSDKAVVEMAARTIPFLSFYVFADGVTCLLNGIIKGCGKQALVMPIVVVAYWIVGLPLAYYMTFYHNKDESTLCNFDDPGQPFQLCGILGLVFGMTVGTWTHFLLLALVIGLTLDWKKEAILAIERLSLEKEDSSCSELDGLVVSEGDVVEVVEVADELTPLR